MSRCLHEIMISNSRMIVQTNTEKNAIALNSVPIEQILEGLIG